MSVCPLHSADDDDSLESLSNSEVAEFVAQNCNGFVEVSGHYEELGIAKARMSCREQIATIQTCLRVVQC